MELIDTHAHLYTAEFAEDLAYVMQRSQAAHVHKIYMPNIDVTTIEPMLAVEAAYPTTCHALMGLHPCAVAHRVEKQLATIEHWLAKRAFVALGEIGIDLYHSKQFLAQQEMALATQLRWAQQYHLPVVIHCRAATHPTLNLLERYQDGQLSGVIHCFEGSLREAQRCIALGFYLGIGGRLTFEQPDLANVIAQVELKHLVLETDAPYLAPVPYRKQRNEPAYLYHTAQKLASLKGISLQEVAHITSSNARNLFSSRCGTID